MAQTAEKVTSRVAQKSLSNKTEETVAQNTPSQDDPFYLGHPHACIPQPQDTKGEFLQVVIAGGGHPPELQLEQRQQQALVPGQRLNQTPSPAHPEAESPL